MHYYTFKDWLKVSGETWAKYVCGDLEYKIKRHLRYAMYLQKIEIEIENKKPQRRQPSRDEK